MRATVLVRSAGWVCVSGLAIALLLSLYHQPVGPGPVAIAVAVALLSAFLPFPALCTFAALGPLGAMIFSLATTEPRNLRYQEALALSFIAGWTARRAVDARPLAVSTALKWCAVLLAAVIVASAITNVSRIVAEQPETPAMGLVTELITGEHLITTTPLTAAVLLIEGLLLLVIAADAGAAGRAHRETVLRMLVLGAAAAATFNVLRIATAAVVRDDPWQAFVTYLVTLRVNVHYGDLNAAGSYFAMMLAIAIGLASRMRWFGIPSAFLIGIALWLTGSRTALAAMGVATVSGIVLAFHRYPARRIVWAAALVTTLLTVGGLLWLYPQARNAPVHAAWEIRVKLAEAAMRMVAEAPLLGLGIGRFHELSDIYGRQGYRENAHNYFIQLAAEIGVIGLFLFVGTVTLAFRGTWPAARASLPVRWLIIGVLVFLVTSLAGHPFLAPDAALPFWIALGLVAASAEAVGAVSRRFAVSAMIAIALIVATLPMRIGNAVRSADMEHAGTGFSRWHRDVDGRRYRWAGGQSSLYVSASARSFRISLRHGPAVDGPIEVAILLEGREVNRILLPPTDEWREVRVTPARTNHPAAFLRIELQARMAGQASALSMQATDTAGVMMVGPVAIDF